MPASDQEESNSSIPFLTKVIATGLFSGYIPWASGTCGTIVGVLIYLLPGIASPSVLIVLIVVGLFAGVMTSAKVASVVGHKLTRTAELAKSTFQPVQHATPDPSIVVIDEIVGVWVALVFLPKNAVTIATAFIIFRTFDIIKPPPARQLERVPNGWGIMLDDVVAGIYANVATQIIWYVLREFVRAIVSL